MLNCSTPPVYVGGAAPINRDPKRLAPLPPNVIRLAKKLAYDLRNVHNYCLNHGFNRLHKKHEEANELATALLYY